MIRAGAIYGEAILDDSKWQSGTKNIQSSTAGMTKSFFTAQLAVDAFRKILSASIEITKKAIKSAIDFNETQNKFQVIYKKGTKTYEDAIKAQKNLTDNYGLSKKAATEMLSATGDLLTGLGFSTDAALDLSNSVQELAVDLASFQNIEGGAEQASIALTKAILGETEMAKSLGIVIRQNTKEFNEQVKQLMETKGMTEIQAKAELILAQAYTQSKNALGDYGRTADSTANMQRQLLSVNEDIVTQFGSAFMPIVHEITASMLSASKSLRDFLNDEKNIAVISQTLGGIWESVKSIGEGFGSILKSLAGNANLANIAFQPLAIILKSISSAFLVLGKLLAIQLEFWAALIDIAKDAGKVIGVVIEIITNKKTWEQGWGEIKDIAKDSFDSVVDRAQNFGKDFVSDLTGIWKDTNKATDKELDKLVETVKDKTKDINNELNKNKDIIENQKEILGEWEQIHGKTYDEMIADINKKKDEFIAAGIDEVAAEKWAAGEIKKIEQEKNNTIIDGIKDVVEAAKKGFVTDLGNNVADAMGRMGQSVMTGVQGVLDGVKQMSQNTAAGVLNTIAAVGQAVADVYREIANLQMDQMEAELEAMQEQHELELEELDAEKEEELLSIEDQYNTELELLNMRLESGAISEQEYEKLKAELEKKKEEEKAKTIEEAEKKKEEKQKKQKEKENAEKKRIFEANKTNQIAMIWIQAALGIVSAWANAMQLGPIAGIIMGAILCHGAGVEIKMYDGTLKKVENIKKDEYIMGDDDTPRKVLSIHTGKANLYEISYNTNKWTCTFNHILSLTNGEKILNIRLDEYLRNSEKYNNFRLYKKVNNKIKIINNFEIKEIGINNFYGFELDGNRLYKLKDDTITHNTALIIAMAVAQTIVVSTQQFIPEKAEGGIAGGLTKINEEGGEIVNLPNNSLVIPNDISQQIAGNVGGGDNITIYVNFRGVQITNEMDLQHVSDYVSNDIARKLELA